MVDSNRIGKSASDRSGITLIYKDNRDSVYNISIYVDAINCICVLIGDYSDNYAVFDILHDFGYSVDEYIGFIKNNMNGKIPSTHSIEIYKDLLDDQDFRTCLEKCIKNIPANIYQEEERQIEIARKKYEKALQDALKAFENSVRRIVSTSRNNEKKWDYSQKRTVM